MELKKTLAFVAGAGALLAFTPAASHAQAAATGAATGPFADVPADHWAYAAVKTLQDAKIVVGYPDGTYGGRRPMTRYEFAEAIARLLPLIQPSSDTSNLATKDDLAALRADLQSKLDANQAALDALTRLVNEFQPELERLGQDVSAINTRLANLEGRVAVLEAENERFHVTGEVNLIGEAADSTHRLGDKSYVPFLDKNGIAQPLTNSTGFTTLPGGGTTTTGRVASNRLFEEDDVYHDILLHLTGKLSDTATAHVDLDFGNYISSLENTARAGEAFPIGDLGGGGLFGGSSSSTTGNFYQSNVYQAYLDAPVSLGPLGGAAVKIGRFGTQFTKWTLKQEDADVYTNLTQTDSGNILTDGGWLGFKLGAVGVQGFAGKLDTTPYSQAFVGSAAAGTATSVTVAARPDITINGVTSGPVNNAEFSAVTGATFTGTPGFGQIGAHPAGTFYSEAGLGSLQVNNEARPNVSGTSFSSADSINHAAPVNQAAGVRFTAGSPESLVFGATVEQFAVGTTITGNGTTTGVPTTGFVVDPNRGGAAAAAGTAIPRNALYNRVSVYGLDVNGGLPFAFLGQKKGAITVQGAYTVSAEGANSGFNNVGNNQYYQSHEELAGFNLGKLGVQAGYQFVGPYFSAPGYWGKIGNWTNPTNVKGPVYFLKYPLTPKLALNADYEQYRAVYGNNKDGSLVNSPLQNRDHLNRYQVGLGYGLSSTYAVDLGYERVEYDLRNNSGTLLNSGKPIEDYITVGVGHDFNKNASFKLLYQIVHYNDHNTGFGETGTGDNNYSGNVAVGQFSLKF